MQINIFRHSIKNLIMINDSWNGVIPIDLIDSEDYKALSAQEKNNFSARLHYCSEIADKAYCAVEVSNATLIDVIDEIELDVLSILSLGDVQVKVSPYIVHSSWTFECDRRAMAQFIVPDVIQFLSSDSSALKISGENAKKWLHKWAHVLRLLLWKFVESSSFTEAITQLILIDAILSAYLLFAATARLNVEIE